MMASRIAVVGMMAGMLAVSAGRASIVNLSRDSLVQVQGQVEQTPLDQKKQSSALGTFDDSATASSGQAPASNANATASQNTQVSLINAKLTGSGSLDADAFAQF